MYYITKTCLYNSYPLKPHFYIVKQGFTGVYIIFLISPQKHRLWVLIRTASQSMFWADTWKIYEFLSENFHFLVVKFSVHVYLNRLVFVMNIFAVKAQISLCIHMVWSSSQSTRRNLGSLAINRATSKECIADCMQRLIRVFTGCSCHVTFFNVVGHMTWSHFPPLCIWQLSFKCDVFMLSVVNFHNT